MKMVDDQQSTSSWRVISPFKKRLYLIENMVARDGVEPPTPAFSELSFPVFPTTSKVAVGLLNTGKYGQDGWIVGDCPG